MSAAEDQSQGPVIRDRRRIDPVTGQPKAQAEQPGAAGGPSAPRQAAQQRPGKHAVSKPGGPRPEGAEAQGAAARTGAEEAAEAANSEQTGSGADGAEQAPSAPAGPDLAAALAERTADVQRIQAEYANYRKRVERDRASVREYAVAGVLAEMLPVLDDIGRAREHGELTGGFKSVAESFEAALTKLGLTAFGDAGEPFDPKVHEALMHSYSPDVTETTCVQVLLPGYRVGDRILRPARVAVAEPTDPAGSRPASDTEAADPEPGQTGAAAEAADEPDDGAGQDETS